MTRTSIDAERDLVLERVVDASAEALFEAWTVADKLKPWFCPSPWQVVEAELDPVPGGIFRTAMAGPDGVRMDGNAGCFLEVVPNRKLVWTDKLGPGYQPNADGFFTGIIELEPQPDGRTLYRAIAKHADAAAAKDHADMGFHVGWGAALDQLLALLAG